MLRSDLATAMGIQALFDHLQPVFGGRLRVGHCWIMCPKGLIYDTLINEGALEQSPVQANKL